MSVAKSHSSMASRCVIYEMPHDNTKITEGGKLNLQKIRGMRPEYADAIEKGFEWNILLWQAEEAFPALIDLLQETGNLGQQQAMDETRWQVALKISSSAQRLLREAKAAATAGKTSLTTDEIWDIVEREALRGSPKFANEVVDLRKYVMSMGGEDGVLLKDIISFSKTLKHPRVVTGMVLAAIAETDLGED